MELFTQENVMSNASETALLSVSEILSNNTQQGTDYKLVLRSNQHADIDHTNDFHR